MENAYTTHICAKCAPDMIEEYKKRSKNAMEKRFHNIGIPRKYYNATASIGLYAPECLRYEKGIIWFGESGVGKTWELVGMLRRAMLAGKSISYCDWTTTMCELKCNPNEYHRILAVPQTDILAIDDFEVDNGFTFNYVYDFIKKLYCAEKVVYITCSTLPAQDKIAMRLGEMTKQYEVKFYDGNN